MASEELVLVKEQGSTMLFLSDERDRMPSVTVSGTVGRGEMVNECGWDCDPISVSAPKSICFLVDSDLGVFL